MSSAAIGTTKNAETGVIKFSLSYDVFWPKALLNSLLRCLRVV